MFWGVEGPLTAISAEANLLGTLSATVGVELFFWPALAKLTERADPSRGGRPGFDPVAKFKMLMQQTM